MVVRPCERKIRSCNKEVGFRFQVTEYHGPEIQTSKMNKIELGVLISKIMNISYKHNSIEMRIRVKIEGLRANIMNPVSY